MGLVDAEPVRSHVKELLAAGMPKGDIARAADVSGKYVTYLMEGVGRHPAPGQVRSANAERLLAVRMKDHKLGIRRRVEALMWMGYRHEDIARGSKLGAKSMGRFIDPGNTQRLTPSAFQLLDKFYAAAKGRYGGCAAVHRVAMKRGFAPPQAWTSDSIDDPEAGPRECLQEALEALAASRRPLGELLRELPDDANVDALPVREHIDSLVQQKMPLGAIAWHARVRRSQIRAIYRGDGPSRAPVSRAKVSVARAIVAVKLDPLATGYDNVSCATFVNPVGAARRLQALMWMNHSVVGMAAACGVDQSRISKLVNGKTRGKRIPRQLHERVATLYDELWNKRGNSPKARNLALQRGYLSPLAWDDATIDDPAAQPLGAVDVGQGANGDWNF
jgi:hypothetical protein